MAAATKSHKKNCEQKKNRLRLRPSEIEWEKSTQNRKWIVEKTEQRGRVNVRAPYTHKRNAIAVDRELCGCLLHRDCVCRTQNLLWFFLRSFCFSEAYFSSSLSFTHSTICALLLFFLLMKCVHKHTQLSLRFYTRKGKKKKYANKEVPLKSIKQQQLFTAQRLRWGLTQQYTQHVLTHFADGIEDCSWRMSKNGQSFQLKGRRGRWKR